MGTEPVLIVAVRVPVGLKVKVPLGSMVTGPDRVKVVVGVPPMVPVDPAMVPTSCIVPEKVPPASPETVRELLVTVKVPPPVLGKVMAPGEKTPVRFEIIPRKLVPG